MCFDQFYPLCIQDAAAGSSGIRTHHHLQDTEKDL